MSKLLEASADAFLRFQARYVGRTGSPVGIFVAVDHLRRAGRLTSEEVLTYVQVDEWFSAHLPNPPFYADGNTIGAVTWFKRTTSAHLLERLAPLRALLDRYGVAHDVVTSTDPGRVVYDDDWQVGVVPYRRQEPTPLPDDVVLGPTSAGSKRHLLP